MKIFEIKKQITAGLFSLEESEFYKFLDISRTNNLEVAEVAKEIIAKTKKDGDEALVEYCNKFDGCAFGKAKDFVVSQKEIDLAEKNISKTVYEALQMAYERIYSYHKKQMPKDLLYKDK